MGRQDGIDNRREVEELLANLRAALPELKATYERCSGEWGYEDPERHSRTKSALHFDPDKPLPASLVRKLLKARMAEGNRRRSD